MITRAIETLSIVSGWLAGIGVYGLTIVVFVDVVLRYFFSRSIFIADELSIYFMIYVAFLGAAMTMKQGAHIKVDLLYKRLPKKACLWLDAVTMIVGTIICFIMTYQCALWVQYTYKTNYISPSILETPMWIPMSVIPIGLFLWSLQYAVLAIKAVNLLIHND